MGIVISSFQCQLSHESCLFSDVPNWKSVPMKATKKQRPKHWCEIFVLLCRSNFIIIIAISFVCWLLKLVCLSVRPNVYSLTGSSVLYLWHALGMMDLWNLPTFVSEFPASCTNSLKCIQCGVDFSVSQVNILPVFVWFIIDIFLFLLICHYWPSVLWHCWWGGRKGIQPVKNVVGCLCGYLSGARCRLAYDPADAIATHCLLLQ